MEKILDPHMYKIELIMSVGCGDGVKLNGIINKKWNIVWKYY